MNKRHITRVVAIASVVAAAALLPTSPARAQDALCKKIADLMLKQTARPFHAYTTDVAGYNGNKPEQGEMISTGTAMYIKVHGQWRRSPQTPQELTATMREAAADMKNHSCRMVGSEAVSGVPATHYHVDVTDPDSPSSTELWIGGDGLPLKTETVMDVGGGASGRSRTSTRYEYTNIQAPAVR